MKSKLDIFYIRINRFRYGVLLYSHYKVTSILLARAAPTPRNPSAGPIIIIFLLLMVGKMMGIEVRMLAIALGIEKIATKKGSANMS